MYEVFLPDGHEHEELFSAPDRLLPRKRPRDPNHYRRGGQSALEGEQYFYALAEVTVTIPTYPTVCSHRDIFWYRQPNAGCISRMSLQQLHARFSHSAFRVIS